MAKVTRKKTAYIEVGFDGKSAMTLNQLANQVEDDAELDRLTTVYQGLNTRPGPGRRKVRVSIIVEDVE